MSFCVTIYGKNDVIGRMIYDQWKDYRDTYAQISTMEEDMQKPCCSGKPILYGGNNAEDIVENILQNIFMVDVQPDNFKMVNSFNKEYPDAKIVVGYPPYFKCREKQDEDDTEEWAMSERDFREWYFTHSHKETMAFYNFFMEDEGSFRKIAPQVVEKELYTLWKNDPQLFTDMLQNFDEEDIEEYTY